KWGSSSRSRANRISSTASRAIGIGDHPPPLSATPRFMPWNSASARAPRGLCSSGVMSGTSPGRPPSVHLPEVRGEHGAAHAPPGSFRYAESKREHRILCLADGDDVELHVAVKLAERRDGGHQAGELLANCLGQLIERRAILRLGHCDSTSCPVVGIGAASEP